MNISHKIIMLAVLACVALQPSAAQKMRKADKRQGARMIDLINRTSAKIRTIQCSFTQVSDLSFMDEKTVSKGKMDFHADGSLKWQYVSPYRYTFSIVGGKVTTQSGTQRKSIDLKGNAMLEHVTGMMMNSVSGKSLTNDRDFQVDMYIKGSEWIAFLTPKRPGMKKILQSVHLHFSSKSRMVQEVEMVQANGDRINIMLSDINVTFRK